jgi:hypothetical protein
MSDCEICGCSEDAERQNEADLLDHAAELHSAEIRKKEAEIAALQEQLDIARDITRLLAIRSPQTVDGKTAAVVASWPKSDGKTLTPGYGS